MKHASCCWSVVTTTVLHLLVFQIVLAKVQRAGGRHRSGSPVLRCRAHHMTVIINTKPYKGHLDPRTLHLLDPSCGAFHVKGSIVTFKVPLQTCGTRKSLGINTISYSNTVTNYNNASSSTRFYENDFSYTFRCDYQRKYSVSLLEGNGVFISARKKVKLENLSPSTKPKTRTHHRNYIQRSGTKGDAIPETVLSTVELILLSSSWIVLHLVTALYFKSNV